MTYVILTVVCLIFAMAAVAAWVVALVSMVRLSTLLGFWVPFWFAAHLSLADQKIAKDLRMKALKALLVFVLVLAASGSVALFRDFLVQKGMA